MEALSPRSTNQMVIPKREMERKILDKNAAAASDAQRAATAKNHAPPPPPLVREPEESGERYSTGAFLGKGGFAVCYEGRLARNGRVFAMKVVKSEMTQKKMEEKFRTELQIHSKMRHPHIVRFHRAFAFDKCTYVVLEICPNGSVMDMVKKRRCLTLPEVRRFMIQLCGAVKYLHKRSVAHRDLKMGNLFLDHNMDIKVGDFGLAAIILSEKDEKRRRTLCGTPNYIAPEILDRSKGGHTQKVDIWSLGVICFAMLTGYPPFQSKTQEEIYKKVRHLAYVWPKDSDCGNQIPEEARRLVSSCLNLAEDERPDPDDIVDHPFFNMYEGCITKRLDPTCCHSKPVWLKSSEPRGDRMLHGYSLDYDDNLLAYIEHVDDPSQRYHSCKAAFYALCGVGRKPDGSSRKSVGRSCSKSTYAECLAEDERGLQPVIPLPEGTVYSYPHDPEGDWSLPDPAVPLRRDNSGSESSDVSSTRNFSIRTNAASETRTQAALVAAQRRRKDSQSHAATLRQQAMPGRGSVRKATGLYGIQGPGGRPFPEIKEVEPEVAPVAPAPTRGLAERPIRTRRGAAQSHSGSQGDSDNKTAAQIPKSASEPCVLTVGKTRSQSRRLVADGQEQHNRLLAVTERSSSEVPERRSEKVRHSSLRPSSKLETREAPRTIDKETLRKEGDEKRLGASEAHTHGLCRSKSKTEVSGEKARSSLGVYPLFHPEDPCELLPATSINDVNTDLRHMLSSLAPHSYTRRRSGLKRPRHAYVIKWVDYTNRYGIGYVLDDGSVGCVFKAENGQPASSVVLRDGEKHVRRKALCMEKREEAGSAYSEFNQLVPRNGKPVEIYENCDEDSFEYRGGIRRAFIPPSLFEARSSQGGGFSAEIKFRAEAGAESARADMEKIKRVKLVDQFGKYMIGSLGRHGDEGLSEGETTAHNDGQYIKFYQRLGNVGVWGFGDGAFQFNFPDHTKLVLSPGRTRSSPAWVDFYHLSPSAARYLSDNGKMHPLGFDTRAVASDEAATFLSIAQGTRASATDERIRDVLEANSFVPKIRFISDVLKGWLKQGRLGGRPSKTEGHVPETLWEGAQERPRPGGSGGKFVWVTVGAPGGDGEYRCVTLREKTEASDGQDVDPLRERLRVLGVKP